jgi:hypothetical protein
MSIVLGVARGEKTSDLGVRMRPTPESSTQEVLAGLVERVTFHNAENASAFFGRKRVATAIW